MSSDETTSLPALDSVEALRFAWHVLRAQGLIEPAEEVADQLVELWHSGQGPGQELHEFLGLTWEQYGQWVNPANG